MENLIQFKHSVSFIDPLWKVRSSQEHDLSRWIHLNMSSEHMGLVAPENNMLNWGGSLNNILNGSDQRSTLASCFSKKFTICHSAFFQNGYTCSTDDDLF